MSAILFNRFFEKRWQDVPVYLSAGRTGGDHSFLCDVQRFAACDTNNVIFKQWIWRMNTSDGVADREILKHLIVLRWF